MRASRLLACALLVASCGGQPTRPATTAPAPVAPAPADLTPASTPAEPALPLWSAVKRGTLPNGLTYYVLPHRQPKQRAALWLAVNAGALQEDDDQQGLAHFVEHMAFNGTAGFPKMAIVDYLEKIGMEFGPHVNAYTSFDETVYQLQVPTDDPAFVDKGLDVLREWAGKVSFDPAEVDKERGVVLEEWRLGRGAWSRVWDKQASTLFRGTRYAKRMPIGKPEILKGAPRAALTRFYQDWYRPDLMAVIVVGDVEPAAIEPLIAAKFGDLKGPAKPRPRTASEALTADGTKISIETDPELGEATVAIHNLFGHRPEASEADFRHYVIDRLYHLMLGERLAQLGRQPDAPFAYASSSTGDMTRQYETFSRFAVAKDGEVEATLEALFAEVLRVERHGFTATEFERAKKTALRSAQRSAAEADKQESAEYASELTRHFFEGELVIGRAAEAALWEKLLPAVSLAEVNQVARTWGGADGRVILLSGPAKAAMPTRERVLEIVAAVEGRELPAWNDAAPTAPLLGKAPAPGKIVKETTIAAIGVTEWTLSNGARVVLKPTTFENETFHVQASSPGGLAMVSDKDFHTGRQAATVVALGGVGDLSVTDLGKVLAGSTVRGSFWIGEVEEGAWAQAATADAETLFQLMYLGFTAPRKDPVAFTAWKLGQKTFLANRDVSPETVFGDEMQAALSKNHPRRKPVVAADLDKVDLDRAHAIVKDRFGDVSDFTFTIVGSFDPATLRPLIETYVASLPGKGRTEKRKDVGVRNPKGVVERVVERGSEPKAAVQLVFHGEQKWTPDAERDVEILADVLRIRLREILREDMGGVYGVGVWGTITRAPRQVRSVVVRFGCAPENVAALKQAVFTEIARLQKEGVTQAYLDKVKESRRRSFETDREQNWWWQARLDEAYDFGDDPRELVSIDKTLARITPQLVQAAARRYLDPKQYVGGVLQPAAEK